MSFFSEKTSNKSAATLKNIKSLPTHLIDYQKQKQLITQQLDLLHEEINQNELQWLQLCSLAQQSKAATIETKSTEPLFKDAADINAVPIQLDDIQVATNTGESSAHQEEMESESDEET